MFTLPELPYAYNALEPFIDEKTMQIHHDKHHKAYLDKLNAALEGHPQLNTLSIEELLQTKIQNPDIAPVVRNHGGGHYNHSLFWTIMAAPSGSAPSGKLKEAIDSAFESFEKFQELFSAKGMGRFGSGWVWLVVDGGKLSIIDTSNQDNPLMEGKVPILGLDVWEHAYYLKYQHMRADYIKAWWNVVNWIEVEKRLP